MMTVRLRTVMISLVEAVRRMRRTDEKVKHKSLYNFKHSQAEERLQPQEVCVLHSIMHVCTFTCNTLMSYLEIFWIVLL